ncbi:MAG: discoidin domain-containing protein [Armatimonadetes bacterium]|nr:discoidin domain-containing protein [Armatimonadota bacterium]
MASVTIGFALLLAAPAAPAGELAIHAGELRIVTGAAATPPERRAAELFAAEVRRRTGIEVSVGAGPTTKHTLVLGTAKLATAAGGFQLDTTGGARLRVAGADRLGVVAGVGKLLRLSRFADAVLTLPALALTDSPRLPVRGIYFATHFFNFYHVAPLEEVDRVVEEFALWGGNSLSVWFDMHHFTSLQDPAAQAHLARLKHFADTAHGVGMQFGLTFIANEAYAGSPAALRPKPAPGSYGVELCPSIPEGLAQIGRWQVEELDAFPQVDFIWTWPYDQGGCACEQCRPWGANGFLKASEQLARLFHERAPQGTVWLSTWLFDSMQGDIGEYAGLLKFVREQKPAWFAGILGGTHTDGVPPPLLDRPEPERYPLTWFPEISLYQMDPWGGYGANPLPGLCSRLRDKLGDRTQGGWPYSEGIYEDLNKWLWCRFDWDPGAATDDLLAEYAAYYLGPENTDDGAKLFHLFEQTHPRANWHLRKTQAVDEAADLADRIEARLPAWAKTHWRWRILAIRAGIDRLVKQQGVRTPAAQAALKPLCDELVGIYHADRTFIRPPAFPVPKPGEADNLALNCPVKASSTHPDFAGCEQMLTDGVYSQDDGKNFWVHDFHQGPVAWVVIDLGKPVNITQVRLQFRGLWGKYWFIPANLGFAVSADGEQFEDAGAADRVPREGDPYDAKPWAYDIDRPGRYLRISLGPSQHLGDQYAGTLELVEVEVTGK